MSGDQVFTPDLNCRWRVTEDGYQIEFNGEHWDLQNVAAAVWTGVINGQPLQEITQDLVSRYDAPADEITSDIQEFVRELRLDGLVHEESL